MQILLYSFAFFLVSIGMAALAAIPFLVSLSQHYAQTAKALSVSTRITVHRYNSLTPKKPNIYPIRDANGPSSNDKDPART